MQRWRSEEPAGLYSTRSYCRRVMLGVLFNVQEGRCGICGKPMEPMRTASNQARPMRPTRDHVLPRAMSGPDEPGNLLAAHARCNGAKGENWPSETELAELDRVNKAMGWRAPPRLRRVA